MEYTIRELSQLSGVSSRTLRYYQEIGLLLPIRVNQAGYRFYGEGEVDLLQQILFYRTLGVELERIRSLLNANPFDRQAALEEHLGNLRQRREQLDLLIENVQKTLQTIKGVCSMTNAEKFIGFGDKLVADNETAYGPEIRKQYGKEAVDAANKKVRGMTAEEYAAAQILAEEIGGLLTRALAQGDPAGETAQQACALHEKWLRLFYPSYTKAYHRGLGDLYVEDERFAAYYEAYGKGSAAFFREAIQHYCR